MRGMGGDGSESACAFHRQAHSPVPAAALGVTAAVMPGGLAPAAASELLRASEKQSALLHQRVEAVEEEAAAAREQLREAQIQLETRDGEITRLGKPCVGEEERKVGEEWQGGGEEGAG